MEVINVWLLTYQIGFHSHLLRKLKSSQRNESAYNKGLSDHDENCTCLAVQRQGL